MLQTEQNVCDILNEAFDEVLHAIWQEGVAHVKPKTWYNGNHYAAGKWYFMLRTVPTASGEETIITVSANGNVYQPLLDQAAVENIVGRAFLLAATVSFFNHVRVSKVSGSAELTS